MLFKKEFDIDKDFFIEKPKKPIKKRVAVFVFFGVLILTFIILCYIAYSFNLGSRYTKLDIEQNQISLKEAQSFYFDAIKYYEEGEYDKALEILNKQLSIVEDPDAYNYVGKIYQEKGEIELAIKNFEKALEFKPDFFEVNYELGKIYYSMNDFKNASKYLTKASSIHTDDVEVLNLTAETYKKVGHSDDAVILFEKILELEPNNSFANAKIGEIYFQRLDYSKAIQYFEDSIQITYDENVALMLAKSYFEINNYPSALDVIREILAVNKDNKKALSLKKAIELKGIKPKEEKADDKKTETKEDKPINKRALDKYIAEIELSIKANWTPPKGSNLKKASIKFSLNSEGELISNSVYQSSGMAEFDKSALSAIEASAPYPPFPKGLDRETLDIIFTFDFNVK